MAPGLQMKLGGVHWLEDAKKILKEEFPGRISTGAADLAKKADKAIDVLNQVVTLGGLIGDPGPKSDVMGGAAIGIAEWILGIVVGMTLDKHRKTIQSKLGVTAEQLNNFFGIKSRSKK